MEGRPEAVVVGACMERQGDSEGGGGGDRDEQGAASISGWPPASGGTWDHKFHLLPTPLSLLPPSPLLPPPPS